MTAYGVWGGKIYYCTDRFHSMLNIEADLHVQCTILLSWSPLLKFKHTINYVCINTALKQSCDNGHPPSCTE